MVESHIVIFYKGLFRNNVQEQLWHYIFQVSFLKEFIPKAFPEGDDLILDAEILLIDTRNGQPLPFGTLGIHKVQEKYRHGSKFICIIFLRIKKVFKYV